MVREWRDLSVLIVGCGSIGKRHARVLNGLGVKDLRGCDPSAEQRASLLAQVPTVKMSESYQEGLRDAPDTVLICTPPWLHIPQAKQAIQAACHVLSEKPLSDSTEGIDDLVTLAEQHRKKLMVGLCFRYHDGLVKAKSYLDAGRIGRLVSVRALAGEHLPHARPDYRTLFSAQVGGAFDVMHEIDLAIWYAGQTVSAVHAFCGTYSDIGITAPDVAEVLIQFKDRCLASLHLDFFQHPRRRQIELMGTRGTIIVEFARWEQCNVSMYEADTARWEHVDMATERDDMFRAEDREFLQAVAEDLPIRCTVAEARKSLEVVLAAQDPSYSISNVA
jgi:predicted dehydrogenase